MKIIAVAGRWAFVSGLCPLEPRSPRWAAVRRVVFLVLGACSIIPQVHKHATRDGRYCSEVLT